MRLTNRMAGSNSMPDKIMRMTTKYGRVREK